MRDDDIAISTKLGLLAPLAARINAMADEATEMLAHVEQELARMRVDVDVRIEPELEMYVGYVRSGDRWQIVSYLDGVDSGYTSVLRAHRQRRMRVARYLPALLDAIGHALQQAIRAANGT